jgi:hypothetical protein
MNRYQKSDWGAIGTWNGRHHGDVRGSGVAIYNTTPLLWTEKQLANL